MSTFMLKDIKESNRIKKEICESCMEDLKGTFSDKQLERFEKVFYEATAGVVLGEKRGQVYELRKM